MSRATQHMRSPGSATRRSFLRTAAAAGAALGPVARPLALNLATLGSAAALAQAGSDYKALVCVFLFGGNDAANMVLPTDTDSWQRYTTVRSQAPDPIALRPAGTPPDATAAAASPAALGGVLALNPAYALSTENRGRGFAVHPVMTEVRDLFDAGRLSVLANIGPLVVPLTKAEYRANSKPRPVKLFSHNDQQSTWQALATEGTRVGWGGRLADVVAASNASVAGGGPLFTSISASGNAVFLAGDSVAQYQVSSGGAVAIAGLGGSLFGSTAANTQLRAIITGTGAGGGGSETLYAREIAALTRRSIDAQAAFQGAFAASVVAAPTTLRAPSTGVVAANPLAVQLQTVARVMGARTALGQRRQVFFVSLGGFDNHDNQNRNQADLLSRVSHALGYFDATLTTLGLRDQVTTFTASDFGRTFTSNGDGTDHGWGSHHLVMGGAVRGREIVGRFPVVGLNHDDEVGSGSLLPQLAVDQLGATLGRWFGVGEAELDAIFPNLRNFNRDLGFLRST
jgi:uncharacterized protein (DUF1501 family)